jgi:hypothetical protein
LDDSLRQYDLPRVCRVPEAVSRKHQYLLNPRFCCTDRSREESWKRRLFCPRLCVSEDLRVSICFRDSSRSGRAYSLSADVKPAKTINPALVRDSNIFIFSTNRFNNRSIEI